MGFELEVSSPSINPKSKNPITKRPNLLPDFFLDFPILYGFVRRIVIQQPYQLGRPHHHDAGGTELEYKKKKALGFIEDREPTEPKIL